MASGEPKFVEKAYFYRVDASKHMTKQFQHDLCQGVTYCIGEVYDDVSGRISIPRHRADY